jgi:outer membrane PBP1 activator LpoA protein
MTDQTMFQAIRMAEKHMEMALEYLAKARTSELGDATKLRRNDGNVDVKDEQDHARHMLANRALVRAETLIREAMEQIT